MSFTSAHMKGIILRRIKLVFYSSKKREDVKAQIRQCETCQQQKWENISSSGLLLVIPSQTWEDISTDFTDFNDKLPYSSDKSVIFVVVDRLSKFSHFILISHPFTATSVA